MNNVAKISFFLIVLFMLFACVTPNSYNLKLNSLIGASKDDIEATKEAVSGLNNSIKKIESEMKILGEAKVEQITNLEKLEEAKSLYNVRNVEYLIKEVPFAVADFKLTTEKKMTTIQDLIDLGKGREERKNHRCRGR